MSHIPWIDKEGTCRRVHSCQSLGVDDILQSKLTHVVPVFVVCMLSQQTNCRLGIIDIQLWHVEIVNEIDQLDLTRRPKLFASFLFKGLFELDLQIASISVVIEVDLLVSEAILLSFNDTA